VGVIGGGISGLAAAWDLARAGAEPIVLESGARAGGVIVTERRDGFIAEGGPDGFLASEPELPALAQELGIGDQVVDQLAQGSYRWTGRRLERLEEGEAAALLGIAVQGAGLRQGFRSFAGGMADLTEGLAAALGASVRVATAVTKIERIPRGYRLSLMTGAPLDVQGVVLAVPAGAASRLLVQLGVAEGHDLEDVVYFPSLTVSLAYRDEQVSAPLEGTGFIADEGVAGGPLRACTYAARKYPNRAPPGHTLLRAFLGSVEHDPSAVAHGALAGILGIRGAPLWSRTFSWVRGLPRYGPGHGAQVAALRRHLAAGAPLAVAGAGVDGAGVSACVRSGRAAAQMVLAALRR